MPGALGLDQVRISVAIDIALITRCATVQMLSSTGIPGGSFYIFIIKHIIQELLYFHATNINLLSKDFSYLCAFDFY